MECTALQDMIDWLQNSGDDDQPDRCPDDLCDICATALGPLFVKENAVRAA